MENLSDLTADCMIIDSWEAEDLGRVVLMQHFCKKAAALIIPIMTTMRGDRNARSTSSTSAKESLSLLSFVMAGCLSFASEVATSQEAFPADRSLK